MVRGENDYGARREEGDRGGGPMAESIYGVTAPGDIDGEVTRWMKTAYELDV
jgi:hypothetical protein